MSDIRLIGIGSCGANIVKEFEQYGAYEVTYIDNERHNFGDGTILPEPETRIENVLKPHEWYDALSFNWFDIEGDSKEIQIFLSGASDISGIVLQVLEHLEEKKCKVDVFYIKPELKFLSELQKTQNKITFGVLQEYSRSGLIDNMIIIDNAIMGQLAGKVSIADYFPSINSKIAQFVHTFNFCKKNDPIFGQKNTFLDITRIGTLGYGMLQDDINLFYDLLHRGDEIVFPLEVQYYFLVPEDKIKNDENLMAEILQIVEKEEGKYKSISYGVFGISAEQEDVSVLVYLRTSKIQTV